MNYIELTITFQQYQSEYSDILIAELSELDFDSFQEEEESLKAYTANPRFDKKSIEALQVQYPDIPFQFTIRNLENVNWNEEWEKHFDPILINECCHIRAPFHKALPGIKYDIVIEPKMSFGTGHHATTTLMIDYLLETDCTQKVVLDMGCGTGVLGILTRMKNALHIDFVDNDDWAFLNTAENCGRNDLTGYDVFKGGIEAVPGDKKYDIILANINRNVLLEQIMFYAQWLNKDGVLLLSGILIDDKEVIQKECAVNRLQFISEKHKNEWIAMKFSI
ncbi:MAG: 50S ribosomal protein L11 methyltransferase [Bacteroidetes bacterium]|jgi:ribosomal protein L11 methyltransferase|nr:50S ribosomal protein L11 methyltransferase [Bacteroidota bacterium]